MRRLPPHLRAPAVVFAAALVAMVIVGATHGPKASLYALPIPLAVGAFFYTMARGDSDYGAFLRRQLDERQALKRLEVQAMIGRVLSLAVAVAYIVSIVTHAVLWPWAILLGLIVVTFLSSWLRRGERDKSGGEPM